ncbi:MAG: SDR family oxidoreductase [Acidobacteriota bacterium]
MSGTTIVTGATGYLGGRLAASELLAGRRVIALVRAEDHLHLRRRRRELEERLGAIAPRLVTWAWEPEQPPALPAALTADVDRVVHAAAVTRFDVSLDEATRGNVVPTEQLLASCHELPALQRFVYLSSIHASGLSEGELPEEPIFDRPDFANHYEWSKWQGERLVIGSGLPWTIARVGTVTCDDDEGRVVQRNAFHLCLRLLHGGLLSTLPGRAEVRPSLVSGDLVVRCLARLLEQCRPGHVHHLVTPWDDGLELGELVDLIGRSLRDDALARSRAVAPPSLIDRGAWEALQLAAADLDGSVLQHATRALAPFAAQLFIDRRPRTDSLSTLPPELLGPPARELVPRTLENLWRPAASPSLERTA